MSKEGERWGEVDQRSVWHPFTDQEQWEDSQPLVICRAKGCWLYDEENQGYLDANSSIWTNIHGHNHPAIVEAIQKQAQTLCHSSFLGFTNDRASELALRLTSFFPGGELPRCFFSDNGSTALEVAFKMSLQWRQQNNQPEKTRIIAFENAYHGDTLGASSVGGVSRFVKGYGEVGLQVTRVRSLEQLGELSDEVVRECSALVIEPLIQGVNQMSLWPMGMLKALRKWTQQRGVHLILDEVMTGFGRTGKMFACQHEEVIPDFLCLAKGLTGGAMPLAATLTSREIYEGFKGEGKTFYYGHSYTGNPLGCAAALANLDLFARQETLENVERIGELLELGLQKIPGFKMVRRVGLILAFEIEGEGQAFCAALKNERVLTRPILNTIVIMPPLCLSEEEAKFLLEALAKVAKANLS